MATRESINKRKRSVLPKESEEEEEKTTTHYESITNQTKIFSFNMAHRESFTNQTKVSLNMAKHLFSKESDKNVVFSPLSLQVMLSIIAAASEGLHNNSFSTSSVPNPSTISTPSPLISFPSSYLMLLLPAGLASLSPKVCGLIKPFLFNLPSKKQWLPIIKPL